MAGLHIDIEVAILDCDVATQFSIVTFDLRLNGDTHQHGSWYVTYFAVHPAHNTDRSYFLL